MPITPNEPAPLVRITGVGKTFSSATGGAVTALRDVHLAVFRGEFLSIVGPSGCGKSTLLRLVAGLASHTEGEIHVGEMPVDGPRADTGMMFQDSVLLPWRTVLENAILPADILGMDRGRALDRARTLLGTVGLSGFEGKYPHELSGGMRQRAAIVRTLLHDPTLLLLDEPFGALDAMTREQLNLELQRIWLQAGKTVLLVTHSIQEAAFLSQRVAVMSHRPGTMTGIVEVPFPHPRPLTIMSHPEYGRVINRIRETLDREA